MLFAHEDRPADTRSLRLLMRLILWRWRCSQPGAPQYMSEGDDEKGAAEDGDSGDGGGDWWGDGEACADTPEDLMDLCEPPGEEEWEGSAALEAKLLEMASQAYLHYISPIAPLYLRSISTLSASSTRGVDGAQVCPDSRLQLRHRRWRVSPLRAERGQPTR